MNRVLLIALCALLSQTAQGQELPFQNTIAISPSDSREQVIAKAAHVIPTANQLRALNEEFIAFVHFGPNSFTGNEWGNGLEDPKTFNLQELDTDQWCRAMRDAGIKLVILTAKHHDGFVLWQSRYTTHGVASSPFRGGRGDVLKELAASCKKYGLKLGIYLSPADLFQIESPLGLYGNLSKPSLRTIPRAVAGRPFANKTTFQFEVDDYNEYFLNQLFELLTEYGPVHEVWFDGAHPKTKGGQTYNYAAWKELIHTLAPEAVIFGREDIRWCGNEGGATRSTEFNVVPYNENPQTATIFPDMTAQDLASIDRLMEAKYLHYQQAETNTSIREGWFYRDDLHQQVRSADDVFDIYERSVGGNSTFLLNIPPNRQGKFSPQDVAVLQEVGVRIQETYSVDLLEQSGIKNRQSDGQQIVIELEKPTTINRVVLQEAIAQSGERVEQHALDAWIDGAWKEVIAATNVGYKRILRFDQLTTDRIRVRILAARATPKLSTVTAHYYRSRPPQLTITRQDEGLVSIAPTNAFRWKAHGHTSAPNEKLHIYYTTNGSQPTTSSPEYVAPFALANGSVKAMATVGLEQGAIYSETLGYLKSDWGVKTAGGGLQIDLKATKLLSGFSYTPTTSGVMVVGGVIETSTDGATWHKLPPFELGNLVNDPTERRHHFKTPTQARFVRITPTKGAVTIQQINLY